MSQLGIVALLRFGLLSFYQEFVCFSLLLDYIVRVKTIGLRWFLWLCVPLAFLVEWCSCFFADILYFFSIVFLFLRLFRFFFISYTLALWEFRILCSFFIFLLFSVSVDWLYVLLVFSHASMTSNDVTENNKIKFTGFFRNKYSTLLGCVCCGDAKISLGKCPATVIRAKSDFRTA